jgi:hypothetical protein
VAPITGAGPEVRPKEEDDEESKKKRLKTGGRDRREKGGAIRNTDVGA